MCVVHEVFFVLKADICFVVSNVYKFTSCITENAAQQWDAVKGIKTACMETVSAVYIQDQMPATIQS